jgi:hypothetical protein
MKPSRSRPAALILAALSLVLALAFAGGASGATQNIGPYTVTDTVTYDLAAGTTTFTYEVTAPDAQGVKDISHLNVQVCGSPTFVAGPSHNGTLEDGDPSTGQTGPIVKWPNQQNVGTTETYSFTVQGVFQAVPVTLQLKNADLFEGTVQGLSCDPPPPPPVEEPRAEEQPPAQQPPAPLAPPQLQPPGEQEVAGERVSPGEARLAGATGCRSKAFKMSVRGREIRSVVFTIDGKRVKTVRRAQNGRVYSITIRPKSYSEGSHLVTARVRFTEASQTPSKRLRARFVRCARRVAPAFTG